MEVKKTESWKKEQKSIYIWLYYKAIVLKMVWYLHNDRDLHDGTEKILQNRLSYKSGQSSRKWICSTCSTELLYKGIQEHCDFHVTYKTTPNDPWGKLKTVQCLGENALRIGCC